jgi:LPS sulfotransferase NodH
MTGYVLFATPRTGSYLLCEVLTATGVAGRPTEYLAAGWRRSAAAHNIDLLADLSSYLALAIRNEATPNGVFGIKATWRQFDELSDRLRPRTRSRDRHDLADELAARCGHVEFAWIRRRDKVRQAVSFWRALQTGEWSRYSGPDPMPGAPSAAYDFGAIRELGRQIEEDEASIQAYLDHRNARHLEVWYEDLSRAPERIAARVLEHLGLPMPARMTYPASRLVRQADAITDAWCGRYFEDLLACASST